MKRTHKHCSDCREDQPLENFRFKTNHRGGKARSYLCRACERLRARECHARKAAEASSTGQSTEAWKDGDEFRQIVPWPWPAGAKVFEDVKLRRVAA